jgi:cyanophycin synthetase
MATAGDRRDDDIIELGRTAARFFDTLILREDANNRGRSRGDTAALIERGVREAMANDARTETIEIVLDELEATRRALDLGKEGDLVVVCVDHANDVWKELQRRQHGATAGSAGAMTAVTMLGSDEASLEVEA